MRYFLNVTANLLGILYLYNFSFHNTEVAMLMIQHCNLTERFYEIILNYSLDYTGD